MQGPLDISERGLKIALAIMAVLALISLTQCDGETRTGWPVQPSVNTSRW